MTPTTFLKGCEVSFLFLLIHETGGSIF